MSIIAKWKLIKLVRMVLKSNEEEEDFRVCLELNATSTPTFSLYAYHISMPEDIDYLTLVGHMLPREIDKSINKLKEYRRV